MRSTRHGLLRFIHTAQAVHAQPETRSAGVSTPNTNVQVHVAPAYDAVPIAPYVCICSGVPATEGVHMQFSAAPEAHVALATNVVPATLGAVTSVVAPHVTVGPLGTIAAARLARKKTRKMGKRMCRIVLHGRARRTGSFRVLPAVARRANSPSLRAMSGVFLSVVDVKAGTESKVVRPTVGGYPHITLVYSGSKYSARSLFVNAQTDVYRFIGKTFSITRAFLNSFHLDDGTPRHDVLMGLGRDENSLRDASERLHKLFGAAFADVPGIHITHGTYSTRAEAEAALTLLAGKLPCEVKVVGFTID